MPSQSKNSIACKNLIKIIGGRWRGRNLSVADEPGLRPTANRIRETLFNWLSLDIASAVCLDCFAGSGALGFEAASRGAQQVVMVEPVASVYRLLQNQIKVFEADQIDVYQGEVMQYLQTCQLQFNFVFIDPPYAKPELRDEVLKGLIEKDLLQHGCKLFIEWPKHEQFELNGEHLTWLKLKNAGQVSYGIAQLLGNG